MTYNITLTRSRSETHLTHVGGIDRDIDLKGILSPIKNSPMWDCIGRIYTPQGNLLRFKLNDNVNLIKFPNDQPVRLRLAKTTNKIFPAVITGPIHMIHRFGIGEYPREWIEYYIDERCSLIESVFMRCCGSFNGGKRWFQAFDEECKTLFDCIAPKLMVEIFDHEKPSNIIQNQDFYFKMISSKKVKNLLYNFYNLQDKLIRHSNSKIKGALQSLGFQIRITDTKDIYFDVPTPRLFRYRWHQLRENNPKLIDINLVTVQGVASDFFFAWNNANAELVVSLESEFMHDVTSHWLPNLYNILMSSNDVAKFRIKFTKLIYQKLKILALTHKTKPKLHAQAITALGSWVDVTNNQGEIESEFLWEYVSYLSVYWINYFEERYSKFNQKKLMRYLKALNL